MGGEGRRRIRTNLASRFTTARKQFLLFVGLLPTLAETLSVGCIDEGEPTQVDLPKYFLKCHTKSRHIPASIPIDANRVASFWAEAYWPSHRPLAVQSQRSNVRYCFQSNCRKPLSLLAIHRDAVAVHEQVTADRAITGASQPSRRILRPVGFRFFALCRVRNSSTVSHESPYQPLRY